MYASPFFVHSSVDGDIESLDPQCRPFKISRGADRGVFCRVPEPSGLFMDSGWNGLEPRYKTLFRVCIRTKFQRLTFGGSQTVVKGAGGFMSLFLLSSAQVGVTPPGFLIVWCW